MKNIIDRLDKIKNERIDIKLAYMQGEISYEKFAETDSKLYNEQYDLKLKLVEKKGSIE